ncbi:YebC/PmpR family DNA-binding transcriptional regulator [Pseudobacteriovorax antillogorgiicola]|uniref:Probable transcriptional regulatory protein SAMN06296036_1085 n=1 Tax=Pseudobacteriovorax antillogorgiicola TaxID=1513793 RepID=A0A1Y6BYF9_9BACT|nr:YebC/PmpR family DNA-binding transcriptional regulator [Pseudobacteriovorax antillogorgiicola]TCS53190.1 YebC/PmpR family DNA-binding regulatory protein [Pseudobacteriovorax antillogorgiicola]SMF24450.1 DNA-binding regulatory protein, YebC/PmpR family [Pseudobacteriovorax antillogorgiicola]
MGRKSAKIAVRKGAADKARGQVFTKALKDVFKASKSGSSEPASNFLLRVAVERAKKLNVPKDNIEKAIKKGQGSDGAGFDDVYYEGYGPGGIAIFVETSTDNNTRTVANVRSYFRKCDGTLGTAGSLEFVFNRIALFTIPSEAIESEDDFTLAMIDAGAEEVELIDGVYEVSGAMTEFGAIQEKLMEIGVTPDEASLVRVPITKKSVTDEDTLSKFERLIDLLDEDEDVVTVYHNLDDDA